ADFANGVDLHTQQAATMRGVAYEAVTKEDRARAKAINFGIIYGSGAAGLVASVWTNFSIELTIEETGAARDAFLGRYSTFKRWMDLSHALAQQTGVLPIGRLGRVIEAAWEAPKTPKNGNGSTGGRHPHSAEEADDFEVDEYDGYDESDFYTED